MPKISTTEIALLGMFALIADFATLIPIANVLVTLGVTPTLYCYYKSKRVPAYPSLVAGAIEILPLISMLPAISGGVLAVILIDRFSNALPSPASSPKNTQEDARQKRLNAQQDLRNEERRQAAGYGDQQLLNQLRRETA